MSDDEESTLNIESLIDGFFASDLSTERKLRGANEMYKVLARLNRQVAENRVIGKEAQLTPKPDALTPIQRFHNVTFSCEL